MPNGTPSAAFGTERSVRRSWSRCARPPSTARRTEAVCRVLAEALSVRARDLTVVKGHRARDKLVELRDPPPGCAERLAELRGSGGEPRGVR